MKYYPCLIISKDELAENNIELEPFTNGKMNDRKVIMQLEDYCNIPIVSVRETSPNDNEVLILAADGYIQYHPLTQKRTVILQGDFEPLKQVLTDIYNERPNEDPYEIFCSYMYAIPIETQWSLENWTRDEYKRP